MPTVDLRALATRLDMLKDCVCADGCDRCEGGDYRLPTEAEVRAAIFGAGWKVLILHTDHEYARVEACRPSEERQGSAINDESDDLVLLALLRALEACRE